MNRRFRLAANVDEVVTGLPPEDSARQWNTYPWGLAGGSTREGVGVRDEMVLLDPCLHPMQRALQVRTVRYGASVLCAAVWGAAIAVMLLTAGLWISSPVTPIVWVWLAIFVALMAATDGAVVVPPGGRLVAVVFVRYAPARHRRVLPRDRARPQVAALHQMLLELARQNRLGTLMARPGDPDDVLVRLWSAASATPRPRPGDLLAALQADTVAVTPDVAEQPAAASVTLSSSTRLQRRRARHEAAHAVVAATLGARVVTVTVSPHGEHGGQCKYDQLPGQSVCERAWANLVIAMAGNVADLEHGHHDQGARADIRAALEEAATIVSCGQTPEAMRGATTVSTDVLVKAAADQARRILVTRDEAVRAIAVRLLNEPSRTVPGDQLPELVPAGAPTVAG